MNISLRKFLRAKPVPSLTSPRVSAAGRIDVAAVNAALEDVGHVVIDWVWNPEYLASVREPLAARFAEFDRLYATARDQIPDTEIEVYLGGSLPFDTFREAYPAHDDRFFDVVSRGPLPALYRRLFDGDFVISRGERVMRRSDPRFPLRFTGLHEDGQLAALSRRGIRTKRELTLWTPLVDCSDDSAARLLLLRKGETYAGLFNERDKIEVGGVKFAATVLKPWQIRDEDERAPALAPKVREQFERLYAERRCYAPYVPLGSAILFSSSTIHSSYVPDRATRTRYSLDFRAVGEYEVDDANRAFTGKLFTAGGMKDYPPSHG
jgi:hypothetical protein